MLFDADGAGTHDHAALDSAIGVRLAGLRADGDPATAVRVGVAYGRGDRSDMALAGWTGLGMTALFLLPAVAAFALAPHPIASLFAARRETSAETLSLAEPLLLPSVAAAVIGGTSIFGGRGGYTGTIVGALILTVLTTLLTILQMPEGARRVLFGAIILLVTAVYLRITEDS